MRRPAGGQQRAQLGERLTRLRHAAGLSQPQLAARTGISQSKISRVERGDQSMTLDRVRSWLEATDASAEEREEVLQLAEDSLLTARSWRSMPATLPRRQKQAGQLEESAGLIRGYQPVLVPGLLQTAAYTRRALTGGLDDGERDLAGGVMARQERQAILYDPDRRFEFTMSEAALRWRFAPTREHLEQLDRVRLAATRPNVRVLVIPLRQVVPAWGTHGFLLFEERDEDEPLVMVETLTAPVEITDPHGVAEYREMLIRLQAAAVEDAAMLTLLDEITADLQAYDRAGTTT